MCKYVDVMCILPQMESTLNKAFYDSHIVHTKVNVFLSMMLIHMCS